MPIYEYTCVGCQGEFELLVRGGEIPRCPQCESDDLQRQLSVPAVARNAGSELPICDTPQLGCGAPACQRGCQFE
jgi:putative FmdB family regulatory protein